MLSAFLANLMFSADKAWMLHLKKRVNDQGWSKSPFLLVSQIRNFLIGQGWIKIVRIVMNTFHHKQP